MKGDDTDFRVAPKYSTGDREYTSLGGLGGGIRPPPAVHQSFGKRVSVQIYESFAW